MGKELIPGVRIDGARRTNLTEQRLRREAERLAAKPIEDTRVSDAWARADARDRSRALDREEAMAIAGLPPKLEEKASIVDNPDFSRDHAEGKLGNHRKITAIRNVKESPAAWLYAKGSIDEAQLKAADQFRALFEAMGGTGARAIDWRREAVDGGKFPEPIGVRAIDAGKRLALAYEVLTDAHGLYAWKLVGYICGEGRHVGELTETRRQQTTMIDNLKSYLDVLAQHWGLATKRRVS